jgi:hypothetical protein
VFCGGDDREKAGRTQDSVKPDDRWQMTDDSKNQRSEIREKKGDADKSFLEPVVGRPTVFNPV